MYGNALEKFGIEIDKLDASIKSIREGYFLKALVREELRITSYNVCYTKLLRFLPFITIKE